MCKEDITKGATNHKVRTKDKEEANKIDTWRERPIVTDKDGKRKNTKRSKTEPRRVARDRNKVHEPRETKDEDNS